MDSSAKMTVIDKTLVHFDKNEREIDLCEFDFTRVMTGCFCHLDLVETIHLPQQVTVDQWSFINLPNLRLVTIGTSPLLDRTRFFSCPKVQTNTTETFEEVPVNDLLGFAFLIPNYQRGYKWEKEQLGLLLNDLYTAFNKGCPYALQPLIVKDICSNDRRIRFDFNYEEIVQRNLSSRTFMELIDGQQRLTSLHLVLSSIGQRIKEASESFELFYQTKRYTDAHYIRHANECIEEWLDCKFKKRGKLSLTEIGAFKQYILHKVFFFCYRLPAICDESPHELFATINKSIRLTNAELMKALLLNSQSAQPASARQFAFEWDQIERRMNEADFWAFVTNESYMEKTKIDLLFDISAKYLIRA